MRLSSTTKRSSAAMDAHVPGRPGLRARRQRATARHEARGGRQSSRVAPQAFAAGSVSARDVKGARLLDVHTALNRPIGAGGAFGTLAPDTRDRHCRGQIRRSYSKQKGRRALWAPQIVKHICSRKYRTGAVTTRRTARCPLLTRARPCLLFLPLG